MPKSDSGGTIYCQRCLAANAFGLEFCARCGTRLMLLVEPSGLRFDEETVVADYDEHLLERVSALESRLLRVADQIERVVNLIGGQVRANHFDHLLLETLLGVLTEARVVSRGQFENLLRERFERDAAEEAEAKRRKETLTRATARFTGPERAAFEQLVQKGFAHLDRGRDAEGLRALERAAALAPENAPLNSFLGEHFFRAGKLALARDYLSRAHRAEPGDRRLCLLLGLVCGDEGDAARAKELLRESLRGARLSFAAHYALGRLHAAESDWKSALAEFKEAVAARDCAETRCAIAYAYFQLGSFRMALRHATKAVEMDEGYADALYLRGLVQQRLGERAEASKSFRAARAASGESPRARSSSRRRTRPDEMPAPKLFKTTGRGARRLLTGGDRRIAAVLKDDALNANSAR